MSEAVNTPTNHPFKEPSNDAEIKVLEARLNVLELACASMWQILKERHGYTDQQLLDSIREVDARDGAVDGRMTYSPQKCPNCGKMPLSRRTDKCLWCGVDLMRVPI